MNICGLCDARCCKDYVITITAYDALKIIDEYGYDPHDFLNLHFARIFNVDESTVLYCDEEDGSSIGYLFALKSHPCWFLDERTNKCRIYENAPLTCKLYPFNTSYKFNRWARCPYFSKLLFKLEDRINPERVRGISRELVENLRKHRILVRRWNAKKIRNKEECIDFMVESARKL